MGAFSKHNNTSYGIIRSSVEAVELFQIGDFILYSVRELFGEKASYRKTPDERTDLLSRISLTSCASVLVSD